MKIKMKETIVGPKGNGGESMKYVSGHEYNMTADEEMKRAAAWLSDGRAEKKSADARETKEIKKEEKPKKNGLKRKKNKD